MKMSKLVEEYLSLAKKRGSESISDAEDKKIASDMADLKKRFSRDDWDALIKAVPEYIRPMLLKQKEQYIK